VNGDKKFSTLSLLGLALFVSGVVLTIFPGEVLQVIRLWLMGFSAGWLAATWLIKYCLFCEDQIQVEKEKENKTTELDHLADSVTKALESS